jgi:hypothetical protein
MSWLPRISRFGTFISERTFEAEGRVLKIVVGPFVIELCFARIDRVFLRENGDD